MLVAKPLRLMATDQTSGSDTGMSNNAVGWTSTSDTELLVLTQAWITTVG